MTFLVQPPFENYQMPHIIQNLFSIIFVCFHQGGWVYGIRLFAKMLHLKKRQHLPISCVQFTIKFVSQKLISIFQRLRTVVVFVMIHKYTNWYLMLHHQTPITGAYQRYQAQQQETQRAIRFCHFEEEMKLLKGGLHLNESILCRLKNHRGSINDNGNFQQMLDASLLILLLVWLFCFSCKGTESNRAFAMYVFPMQGGGRKFLNQVLLIRQG